MTTPADWRPAQRTLAAVVAAYLALAVLMVLGALLASLVPCAGKLCVFSRVFEGAGIGLLLALLALVFIGRWLGMRWWFVPTLAAVGVGSAALAALLDPPAAWVFGVIAAAAPVIAALVSARLRPRASALALGALAVLIAVIVALLLLGQQLSDRQVAEYRADSFRATAVPLYAPVDLPDAELRLTSTEDTTVIYDLRTPGHDGWLRVLLDAEPDPARCAWPAPVDLGDGITGSAQTGPVRLCRELDGVVAELWPDGGHSDWTREQALEIARRLAPADADWFVARAG